MNLYFLVEGKRTEARVYPAWLGHLLPKHRRVRAPDEVDGNSYYLVSGEGYPRLLDEGLLAAVADINDTDAYNYLVICLDADETEPQDRREEVIERLKTIHPGLPGCTISKVIVQNSCIESWFLGNRTVYPKNPQCAVLRNYIEFYDVHELCPECMSRHDDFPTRAAFHLDYLARVLGERNLVYTKRNPGDVQSEHYLRRLMERTEMTDHLQSFRTFIDLCNSIRGNSSVYT